MAKLALMFPGQGIAGSQMFDELLDEGLVRLYCDHVNECIGVDLLSISPREQLNGNLFSSLLAFIGGVISHQKLLDELDVSADYLVGYSVGQWTAMHIAGMVDFSTAVRMIARRAELMDQCVASIDSGMLAVIGLPLSVVEQAAAETGSNSSDLVVSNINCPGQYTLSGTLSALKRAEILLQEAKPKKIQFVPVAGAWHSPLLDAAAQAFAKDLAQVDFAPANVPVIDNVSGGFLPAERTALLDALAKHICRPVQWEKGVRYLCESGVTRFIESGIGNTLSKFGFFINRKVDFITMDNVERTVEKASA
jgi:[acyl-carrier-protein] S-malonyltransferase